jgi:hypothetical protein
MKSVADQNQDKLTDKIRGWDPWDPNTDLYPAFKVNTDPDPAPDSDPCFS